MAILDWLTTGLGAVAQGLGLGAQYHFNKKDKEFISEENQKARDYQTEMWEKANQYNLPSAQMSRLQAAGLNPNLVYGDGASTLSQYVSAPSHSAPNMNSAQLGRGISDSVIALANLRNQTELTRSQVKLNEELAYKAGQEGRSAGVKANVDEASEQLYKDMVQNTSYKLEQEGTLTKNQADLAESLYEDARNTLHVKINSMFDLGTIDPNTGKVSYEPIYDDDGNEIDIDYSKPLEWSGNYYAALMHQFRQNLLHNDFSNQQAEQLIGNIIADTQLKFSQIGLNSALKLYNYELAKTQKSVRAQIASEIQKNNKLMDVLTSQIGLNNAQAEKLLNDISLGIYNYNLDALKFNSSQHFNGNFSTFFNILQDIYQLQSQGSNEAPLK